MSPTTMMNVMALSEISDLTSPLSTTPPSPLIPSSPLSSRSRTPSVSADFKFDLFTPPPSQDAGEVMPRPRKRRKIERPDRRTKYLNLNSDSAQSHYDRQDSIDTLATALRKRRKIIVIAGAGISVSAGIPDFRSSNGLFASLKGEHKLKGGSGKQLFDASVYKDLTLTSQFHDMLRNLSTKCDQAKPSKFHDMIARLGKEERLLRLYTQNIDGLETRYEHLKTETPLPHKGPWPRTIQLHGGLDKMYCQKCREIMEFDSELFEGEETPTCPKCREADDIRTNELGRRSHGIGRLRPRIVLYNEENLDQEAIGAVCSADMKTRPDCVIVVGTSMKIPGVRRLVSQFCKIVRDRNEGTTIWINPDPEPKGQEFENCWDVIVNGTSDAVAEVVGLRKCDDPVMDDSDTAVEWTDSELEKIKERQGEVRVMLPPSPEKPSKLPPTPLKNATMAVLTPPGSQVGDNSQKKTTGSPIRIKLLVRDRSKDTEEQILKAEKDAKIKKMKNPASLGKKLSDVLGKEGVKKSRKVKTTNPIKGKKSKPKSNGDVQMKIAGKITKPTSNVQVVLPKAPLSPVENRGAQISVPQTSRHIQLCTSLENTPKASASPTPMPEPADVQFEMRTPPAQYIDYSPTGMSQRRETISPKGRLPRGMENLLD